MEATEVLTTTDVNQEMATTTTTAAREPQPPYDRDEEGLGETTSSFSDAPSATERELAVERKSRPVTAATAYRRELWQQGTLVYEDEWGAYEVTEIDENLTAYAEPSEPGLKRQSFDFRPEQTLTFVPNSGASNSGDEGGTGQLSFDEVDTKHALWHVCSALEDAECIAGRPILKMGIERDLRHAKQLLEDHAERNGFDP